MKHFDFEITKKDFQIITLKAEVNNNKSVIKVAPGMGNNMFKYQFNNFDLIYYDPKLPLNHYLNGNPIIYPLPNRVNNCHYEFKDKKYWQEKNSKPIFLHSLVFDEKWEYKRPEVFKDYIKLETFLDIDKNHAVFEGFPFEHKIKLIYILSEDKLRFKYEIINKDKKELPYGICFHTYFNYISNREETYIKAPAKYYMELNEDQIPTGKLLDINNTDFDFNEFKSLKDINIDCAITGLLDEPVVNFKDNLKIEFDYSQEFSHIQFFTPLAEKFFCLEMQTCSADAHNLNAAGLKKAAHLLTVKPQDKSSGWLDYKPKLC
ncbi:MAG TPA: aldose 1-epimerase [Halanaerobiales bacterium]|nr:aldose 1-epimerase [Halanaerobiales bacterium]